MIGITTHLDYLAAAREAVRELERERNDALLALHSSIPVEIQSAIEDVKADYLERISNAQEIAEKMETTVKELVLNAGVTVKGERLQAVYAKGRVSWDAKGLEGYATAVPEIIRFRTEGAPSVSIREVK